MTTLTNASYRVRARSSCAPRAIDDWHYRSGCGHPRPRRGMRCCASAFPRSMTICEQHYMAPANAAIRSKVRVVGPSSRPSVMNACTMSGST